MSEWRPSRAIACGLVSACWACHSYRAPFATPPVKPDGSGGILYVAWPVTSCGGAGYITVMSGDGRFLGNVSSGTTLVTRVPLGASDIVAWNPVVEGVAVPRTMYVVMAKGFVCSMMPVHLRVAFDDWPKAMFGRRTGLPLCNRTWALVEDRRSFDLPEVGSDLVAGQRWLVESGSLLGRLKAAVSWFDALDGEERKRVTFDCARK